jgi:hypothetical protein
MATEKRTTKQHGMEVTQIKMPGGGYYTPVDERIRLALWADPAQVRSANAGNYRVLEHQILPVGERWAYTCVIEYPVGSGNTYPGSDFIDVKDAAGLAKAETSAVGRGLGLAGIAIEGGVASADEMQRSEPRQSQPAQMQRPAQPARHTTTTEQSVPASDAQLKAIKNLCDALQRDYDVSDDLTAAEAGVIIGELGAEYQKARRAS